MRLTAHDVESLPLAAALFDTAGEPVAHTPEWVGTLAGVISYATGSGQLVVAPDGCNPDLDSITHDLIAEVARAAADLRPADRLAVEMLAAGLALVVGRSPVATAPRDGLEMVVAYVQEGVRRTVTGMALDVVDDSDGERIVTPAAVALALVQLVRNASVHRQARHATLRVMRGPTFRIEWEDTSSAQRVTTSRRGELRERWGAGYTRLLADSLGGVVTAPASIAAGVVATTLGFGVPRLSLPVAYIESHKVLRATRAWDEETGLTPGSEIDMRIATAVEVARAAAGGIGYTDIFRGRQVGATTWVVVAPQTSLALARDVIRGLRHENALLTAPEPHATRIYALAALLAETTGGEPAGVVSERVGARLPRCLQRARLSVHV